MNISRSLIGVGIVVAIVIIGGLYIGGVYNSFVRSNEAVDAQWAQIESQYQRRFDLIPNLVESVKGVMTQEQAVFGAIAEARTKYAGAATPDARAEAATGVESALARLLVVMENYPELRSTENVQTLMAELAGTENRISVERMRFNEMVRDYNVSVKTFPGSVLAGFFGFDSRAMFEAQEAAAAAPKVDF